MAGRVAAAGAVAPRTRDVTSPPAIELTAVSKRFGQVEAVKACTLTIPAGAFVSLLGPSGCGKTTLLRMIGGFEHQDRGTIAVHGRQVDRLPPNKRDVNTVFQRYALFPHKDVFANVAFTLEIMRVPRPERVRRVQEMLALVHLEGLETRRASQLSGGQAQRVALARALAGRPKVLLLDEPLAALDLKLRKAMQMELRRIQEEVGTTFLYVTHDQEEALTMSDTVVLMNQGEIIQQGSPQEIYDRPATVFASNFIGEANVLQGTVTRVRGDLVDVSLGEVSVRAAITRAHGVGEPVVLSIRPEKITAAQDLDTSYDNRLVGTVLRRIFLGHLIRLVINVAPEVTFTVEQRLDEAQGLDIGAVVEIGWNSTAAVLLGGE